MLVTASPLPPLQTFQERHGGRHDNLVSTLNWTHCCPSPPPLKCPGYALGYRPLAKAFQDYISFRFCFSRFYGEIDKLPLILLIALIFLLLSFFQLCISSCNSHTICSKPLVFKFLSLSKVFSC